LFPRFTDPTQIIIVLLNEKTSDRHRTRAKLADTMQRLDAETTASVGVVVRINGVEVPTEVDSAAFCDRLREYFAHTETLVSEEPVHLSELQHHTIGAVLSDRFV
jgi:hypothetical protein